MPPMHLWLFLFLLSSAFFAPVLAALQMQAINALYFRSVHQLDLNDIDQHLNLSREILENCESLPHSSELASPVRGRLWKIRKGNLLRPKLGRKNFETPGCNNVRWILIDKLLDWFRYAERNFEMSHEKLEVALDNYKRHDWEFRDTLQRYAIGLLMETSGQSFEAARNDFRWRLAGQGEVGNGNIEWMQQRIDSQPEDYILLSARRNMYLWTIIDFVDQLYDTKMSAQYRNTHPNIKEPVPSNKLNYDDWRLAAYDGFLAAVALRRQFVPVEGEWIKPVASKDWGMYLRLLTQFVVEERLHFGFPVVNSRLKRAYRLWGNGLEDISEDKQVAMKGCLGIIKDLQDYFGYMESLERSPQESEKDLYKQRSRWYIALARQLVSTAKGIGLNAENQYLPSIDAMGDLEVISAYKQAVGGRKGYWARTNEGLASLLDPAFEIIRETEFYLIINELLVSNPSAFPLSQETWRFNALRRFSVSFGRYRSTGYYLPLFRKFRLAVRAGTDLWVKDDKLEAYAWDYALYYGDKGFVSLWGEPVRALEPGA